MLEHKVRRQGEFVILSLKGILDALTLPDLADTTEELVQDRSWKTTIFDMSELDEIDSSGLGYLVTYFKQVRMQGTRYNSRDVYIAGLKNHPKTVEGCTHKKDPKATFKILRFDRAFKIYNSVKQALTQQEY